MDATIRRLAAIDRPSASEGEREAAEWIAGRLDELGAPARVETERAHGGFWWPLGLLNGLALLGVLLGRRIGRVLAAAAAVALVDDLDHRTRWFRRRVLPARATYNVIADAGDHDAAHEGAIYDVSLMAAIHRRFPGLYDRFDRWPPLMWAVLAGPVLLALGRRRSGAAFAAGTIGFMADIGLRPACPGIEIKACPSFARERIAPMLNHAQSLLPDGVRLRVSTALRTMEQKAMFLGRAVAERWWVSFAHDDRISAARIMYDSGRLAIEEALPIAGEVDLGAERVQFFGIIPGQAASLPVVQGLGPQETISRQGCVAQPVMTHRQEI